VLTSKWTRRTLLLLAPLAWLVDRGIAQEGNSINSAERLADSNRTTPLIDQLQFGLRTTLPEQQRFLRDVVEKVDQGQLPRAMVNLIFQWARERNPRVPFPYFQLAMRELAKRRGVRLA
jgi:hypothetical protein